MADIKTSNSGVAVPHTAALPQPTDVISIFELEAAINHWRHITPSDANGMVLSPPVNALSEPYAWMIVTHAKTMPISALQSEACAAWLAYCDHITQQRRQVA